MVIWSLLALKINMAKVKIQTRGFKAAAHKPMGDVMDATSIIYTVYGQDPKQWTLPTTHIYKQDFSALSHPGCGSPVWRKCITVPATIIRLNLLSSPQAAQGTLQFQLYCCYQLLHATWVMSPTLILLQSLDSLNLSTAFSTVLFLMFVFKIFYDSLWFRKCH